MRKMILVLAMIAGAAMLTNCSCNPCSGTCVPCDCSGTNSYTGNWY